MDFLTEFGVKPILLLAQIVNFLILLYILKRFLYGPILKVLEERKKKIAESLENAEEIEKKLESITTEREKKLDQAAKEARSVLEEATKNAGQIVAEAHDKAAKDIEKMLAKTEEQMALEREKMQQEIRAELAELVTTGLEKVAGKVISKEDQKALIKNTLKGLEK